MFIGTTNPGKIREIGALLSPLGITLMPFTSLDVPETKGTFDEIAIEKALMYAGATGGVTISEDSGLIIPALDGLPGIFSARFFDLDADGKTVRPSGKTREEIDALNNDKVLSLMEKFEMPNRAAYFKVVLVVAKPNAMLFKATGEVHGWIATEKKGTNGFGYDPIFVGQTTFGKTFAEIDSVRKNLRSHRRKVLDELFFWASKHRELLV